MSRPKAAIAASSKVTGSAISSGRKSWIRVELQESTVLTTERSDRYAFQHGRLRPGPKRLFRLAFVPARYESRALRIIRHKPLNHLAFAFRALQFVVSHGPFILLRLNQRPFQLPVAFGAI